MIEEKKSLSNLAIKLRVLKPAKKNKYLYELDKYAKDCHIKAQYSAPKDTFFPHRLASSVYFSLEGTPYTQPEFVSQTTQKDIAARKKFEAIYAGIVAYVNASDFERKVFQNSIQQRPTLLKKVSYLLKIRQNGMV